VPEWSAANRSGKARAVRRQFELSHSALQLLAEGRLKRRAVRQLPALVYDGVGISERAAPLIESNPSVMMGKPVVAGTRITVESILERLAAGETKEQLLAVHLRLTSKAIDAAPAFAAQVLRTDVDWCE
jgi:uncharacterized protein (DUF433 family)